MLLSVGPKTHEKVVNWLIYWSHNWSQKHTKIFGISCVNISYLYFTTLYFGAIFKVASVTLVDSCHWCHRPPFQILGNQSSFARWPSTKVLSNMIFCISLQNIYFVQISGWRALVCIFVKVKLVFYLSFHQCNVGTKHCIAFLVVLELSPNYQRPCVHNVYYTLPFNSRKTLTIYLFCRERCLR